MISAVDTHCHLDLDTFDDDRELVLNRALSAGVHAMLLIGFNPDRWKATARLGKQYPFLMRAVGLHPNDATQWSDDLELALIDEIETTSPLAIGEIGLDYFRSADNRDQQMEAFERQLALAERFELPVIIHQRSAEQDVLDILSKYQPVRGVMHCFTGDRTFAGSCIELGMHLGIGGVVTFPKSDDLREAVAGVPRERILLETDAPFLAPQGHRGKRNESAYVIEIANVVAECLGLSLESTTGLTTSNATDLFGDQVADAVRSGMEYQ